MQEIYLDYNATTPIDPEVLEAMLPFFTAVFANPSSRRHQHGREAFQALERARREIAERLQARSATEIIFTAGATEANNFLIKGLARKLGDRGRHIISQATEHPAVLAPLKSLSQDGFEVELLGVDRDGRVDPDELRQALRPDTILVAVMAANNETGVLQPIGEIAALTGEKSIHFHCDAAQAVGKIPVDLRSLGVNSLALSAHKFYGPKGMGALYLRRGSTAPHPLLEGGGQEYGLRSGTSNVAGAVGMARAIRLASEKVEEEGLRLTALRDHFEQKILEECPQIRINGAEAPRLPNTSSLSVPDVDGQALVASIKGLALSTGSACSSAGREISHVLRAMGVSSDLASSTLRISFGKNSDSADALTAADRICSEVKRLKSNRRRRKGGTRDPEAPGSGGSTNTVGLRGAPAAIGAPDAH